MSINHYPDIENGDLDDMNCEPSEPREEEAIELPTASFPDGLSRTSWISTSSKEIPD